MQKKKSIAPWALGLLLLLFAVAMLAAVAVAFEYHKYFPQPPIVGQSANRDWAEFGEFLGGTLSSVFGFLSLMAILLTLYVQRYQLIQTEEASKVSEAGLKDQQATIRKQTFESTFFSLMEFHQELVRGIDLVARKTGRVTRGRDCLRVFYTRRLLPKLERQSTLESRREMSRPQRLKEIRDAYGAFWATNNPELAHYFRTLYRIFKFVDETEAFSTQDVEANKRQYAGIARAQLSNPELALLFYNGLTEYGEKFKALIERYKILENMTLHDLHDAAVDVPLYDPSAYGTNDLLMYFYGSPSTMAKYARPFTTGRSE